MSALFQITGYAGRKMGTVRPRCRDRGARLFNFPVRCHWTIPLTGPLTGCRTWFLDVVAYVSRLITSAYHTLADLLCLRSEFMAPSGEW